MEVDLMYSSMKLQHGRFLLLGIACFSKTPCI